MRNVAEMTYRGCINKIAARHKEYAGVVGDRGD
jgi:hypothetical protein